MLLPVMAPLHHFPPVPVRESERERGETAGFRGGRVGGNVGGGGEEVPERNKKRRWRRFLA